MKKNVILLLVAFSLVVACKNQSKGDNVIDEQDTEQESNMDNSQSSSLSVLIDNEGKYPNDIHLFEDAIFSKRLKTLLGDNYNEMKENFQTVTPIVSENGIYKVTGCKTHDCPAFFTMIIYDAKKDNLYITIEKEENKLSFLEKEAIALTNSLKMK